MDSAYIIKHLHSNGLGLDMINRFTASNGIVIESSPLIYSLTVLKDGEHTDMNVTLIHSHFDEGVFRNAKGKYDKATFTALVEYAESLGIKKLSRGSKDGSRKKTK